VRWSVPRQNDCQTEPPSSRLEKIVSEGSRHEPFCTVLPEQMSESIAGVQIEEKECF
jgi:hypothetical protein